MRDGRYRYRIASVAFGVVALVSLAGIWFSGQTDFLFVPLLLATVGVLCLARYRKPGE